MKRFTLVALSAATIMAQAPAAVVAPPAPVVAATEASAPLAPIHDNLIYGNPALPGSLGYLMITPSDFHGKREAAFQWNGGSAINFSGTGLAVVDQLFAGFESNGGQGQLAAGYLTNLFGAGLRFNIDKQSYSDDNAANGEVTESDTTLAPTSVGVFGSAPVGAMTVYGHLDWGTPVTYGSVTTQTAGGKVTQASRADGISIGGGAISLAKGDNGLSWAVGLELTNASYRPTGVSSDDASSDYLIQQTGNLGKTYSSNGFILAAGFNEAIDYLNGKGDFLAPDWGYQVTLQPTLVTILPIFEHWSVKGGTGLAFSYNSTDSQVGKDAQTDSRIWTAAPDAVVGVRYARGRWAAEAQVANAFLNRGPNFISGQSGDLFGSFAVTANFK